MRKTSRAIVLAIPLWCAVLCISCPSFAGTLAYQGSSPDSRTKSRKVANAVVYKNKKYGFKFVLPETWKGYSIIVGTWSGTAHQGENHEGTESGPMITIRHPLWTKSDPRQDIPIMVLTKAQAEIANDLTVSAAPFGPQEFSRNAKFVFALPPRFDYGDSTGTEEVREILRNHPLHPF